MPSPHLHRQRHEAMGTWFEIRITEGDAAYIRQACTEAFRLLDHLEALLSRFREDSEVSQIRQLAPGESMVLHPETFACLSRALEMAHLTGGSFDPALGEAMDAIRIQEPTTRGRSESRRGRLLLEPATHRVFCEEAPVSLDLGAIGKGFALDRMAEALDDWELGPTLFVGGGSSLLASGPPDEAWEIGLTDTTKVLLRQGAMGCSGLTVKGAHILDPRTRQPAVTPARTWVLSAEAAVADALSTALMVLPPDDMESVCAARPEVAAFVQPVDGVDELQTYGAGLGTNHCVVRIGKQS